MSCNKPLAVAAVLGLALGTAFGPAFAATAPSLDEAMASSRPASAKPAAAAPTASLTSTPAPAAAPASTPTASAVQGDSAHLTLGEIDQLARRKVASALRGPHDAGVPAAAPTPGSADGSLRAAPGNPPGFRPRAHTDPVNFVGAFSDAQGQHVLYQYKGAVYPARVGEKLLNGWVARRFDGQTVTVAQGRRTWTVAMSGDATATTPPATTPGTAPLLGDLASPLPVGMMAAPLIPNGR